VGQGGDRGVEQGGDLVDARTEIIELVEQHPGQSGVVLGEAAVQGVPEGVPAPPGSPLGQLGERGGAAPPGDQRLDHRPAGDAVDVGEHARQFDQGFSELNDLVLVRCCGCRFHGWVAGIPMLMARRRVVRASS
jgi:hypothetical protein